MGRRDDFPGDWVEINFDSFNGKRTAFSFSTAASGVLGDEFISNDGNNWDSSWNPTWFSKAHIDEQGYTVEARIPSLSFASVRKTNKNGAYRLIVTCFGIRSRAPGHQLNKPNPVG